LLNFLGDIGGFSGLIFALGSYICHFSSERLLELFVSTKIFKLKEKKKICGNNELTKLGFEKAIGELDLIHFVRQQILGRSIYRYHTSKFERLKIREKVFDLD
jgi:hypothetical protein